MHVNSVSVVENDNTSFAINHVFVYIESMTEWEFKYVMKLKATQKPMYMNRTVSEDAVLWFVNQLLTVDVLTVVHENINSSFWWRIVSLIATYKNRHSCQQDNTRCHVARICRFLAQKIYWRASMACFIIKFVIPISSLWWIWETNAQAFAATRVHRNALHKE